MSRIQSQLRRDRCGNATQTGYGARFGLGPHRPLRSPKLAVVPDKNHYKASDMQVFLSPEANAMGEYSLPEMKSRFIVY
jgi:hypothetical protein